MAKDIKTRHDALMFTVYVSQYLTREYFTAYENDDAHRLNALIDSLAIVGRAVSALRGR